MKHFFAIGLLLSVSLLIQLPLFAQVKIGGAPGVPVSSAVLELDGGGNRALRLPIINSKEQLGDVANPVNGLLVYGSHTGGLIYYHNGAWFELNSSELGFKLPHVGIYENAGNAVLKITNNGNNGNGLEGISSNAAGVYGLSGVGTGVKGVTADGFGIEATSVAGIGLKATSQSGTSAYLTHTSPSGKALIVENGNVGIGNNNPAYKLDLNGDLNITGRLRANGNGGTNGQVLTSTGAGIAWSTINIPQQVGYRGGLDATVEIPVGQGPYLSFTDLVYPGFNVGGGSFTQNIIPQYNLPSTGVYHISVSVTINTASTTSGSVTLTLDSHGGPLSAVLAADHKKILSPHSDPIDVLQVNTIVNLASAEYNKLRVRLINETNGIVTIDPSSYIRSFFSITKLY